MRSLRFGSLAVAICLSASMVPLRAQTPTADPTTARQLAGMRFLRGAIDMHIHMDPPTSISPGTDIARMKLARALGLRGWLLKAHGESTAGLAYQLGLEMPDFAVIGGIALNRATGGINPVAVEHIASMKGKPGRVIWMPTEDSEAALKTQPNRLVVPVSRNGQLLPEVKEVIALIAKNGLVLASGHLSGDDALLVFREGRAQGVQHMIATHPMDGIGKMNLAQMQEAAKQGAILEFDFRHLLENGGPEVIRQIGPEHCFISEFWTYTAPGPPSPQPFLPVEYGGLEGTGKFVEEMHSHGFTDQELDIMVKENPARLLGLSAGGAQR
jgi:uncharacterized protein DUF6282